MIKNLHRHVRTHVIIFIVSEQNILRVKLAMTLGCMKPSRLEAELHQF